MKSVFASTALCLLLAGCGTGEQSPECKKYVACRVELAKPGENLQQLHDEYGENGTCWEVIGLDETCTNFCKAGLELAKDDPRYPNAPSCH